MKKMVIAFLVLSLPLQAQQVSVVPNKAREPYRTRKQSRIRRFVSKHKETLVAAGGAALLLGVGLCYHSTPHPADEYEKQELAHVGHATLLADESSAVPEVRHEQRPEAIEAFIVSHPAGEYEKQEVAHVGHATLLADESRAVPEVRHEQRPEAIEAFIVPHPADEYEKQRVAHIEPAAPVLSLSDLPADMPSDDLATVILEKPDLGVIQECLQIDQRVMSRCADSLLIADIVQLRKYFESWEWLAISGAGGALSQGDAYNKCYSYLVRKKPDELVAIGQLIASIHDRFSLIRVVSSRLEFVDLSCRLSNLKVRFKMKFDFKALHGQNSVVWHLFKAFDEAIGRVTCSFFGLTELCLQPDEFIVALNDGLVELHDAVVRYQDGEPEAIVVCTHDDLVEAYGEYRQEKKRAKAEGHKAPKTITIAGRIFNKKVIKELTDSSWNCPISSESLGETGGHVALLPCDHLFSYESIMGWRLRERGLKQQEDEADMTTSSCPLCRKNYPLSELIELKVACESNS